MLRAVTCCLLSLSLMMIAACSHQPPVPPLDLATDRNDHTPALSARFQHLVTDLIGGHSKLAQWQVQRSDTAVRKDDLTHHISDIWLQQQGQLSYQRVFHEHRKAVEYYADDLRSLDIAPAWAALTLMVDPAWFQQLAPAGEGWEQGQPVRYYRGRIGEVAIELTWRVDINLPQRIQKRTRRRQETTTLTGFTLQEEPFEKLPADYEIIDYADLGDRERDPFVSLIQGMTFGHDHRH